MRLWPAKRNPRGYEAASPKLPKGMRSTARAKAATSPWLGLDDPRCEGYVVVERGVTVLTVGRPC